jgi:hypothetical protein
MIGRRRVACRVFMSGFPARLSQPDTRWTLGISGLAEICRVCQVFSTGEPAQVIVIIANKRASARILLNRLELNDAADRR